VLGGGAIAGLLVGWLLFLLFGQAVRARGGRAMKVFVERGRSPVCLLFLALAVLLVLPSARLDPSVRDPLEHGVGLLALFAVGWLAIGASYVTEALVLARYDDGTPAASAVERRAQTQTSVLRRVTTFVIVVVVVAAMLMTFSRARALGASMLASAGIIGLIVGFAAGPSIGNIVAGLQIALTGSLSLGDAVIVEGEWGRIEEITLTYVVVRIWDDRRMILPSTYFVTTPFQNWTRESEQLTGTVLLNVDYAVPLAEIRSALHRIAAASPDWDGRVADVQMVDAGERTVQLRVLVSGTDSGATWNVRCTVREGLVEFLQRTYPGSLPRGRMEIVRQRNAEESGG
jgi:small-conductance mechanosensitive channel